jgi:hypothetical protein
MARLFRKSATLIAVYSIALQAMFLGFVPAGNFGFDPFAIICTAGGSEDHQPAPAQALRAHGGKTSGVRKVPITFRIVRQEAFRGNPEFQNERRDRELTKFRLVPQGAAKEGGAAPGGAEIAAIIVMEFAT